MPIWQKAMKISEDLYNLTEGLPRKEDYGFTSQIRRSALSIPANIAEAFGRNHTLDKINFYYCREDLLQRHKAIWNTGEEWGILITQMLKI